MDSLCKTSVHYTRIDKRQARKIYNEATSIVILPHRANPYSIWFNDAALSKADLDNKDFDSLVNEYTYYNCNTIVLGRYPAFYILSNENN